jgi:phage FluMu gp28-like protein
MQLPSTVNKYLDPSFLEAEKLRMDADAYCREYMAMFSDVQGAFFSGESIEHARKEYDVTEAREDRKRYSIGFDPARVRDSSVVTVVSRDEDGHLRVEAIRDFVNVPFQQQLGVIRYLAQVFRPEKIFVEYSGLGMGPCEELERAGLPVERFVPTVASKLEAYGHLKNRLEKRQIAIPASHTKLAVELRMFQFKVTDAGNVTLHHISGQGDDYADSLCFATWAFKENEVWDRASLIGTHEALMKLASIAGGW